MNFFRSDSQQISSSQCWSFPNIPVFDPAEPATGKGSGDAAVNAGEGPPAAPGHRRPTFHDKDSNRLDP